MTFGDPQARLRLVYATFITLSVAVTTLADRFDALRSVKVWAYGYVLVDLFRYELVVTAAFVVGWPIIYRAVRSAMALLQKRRLRLRAAGFLCLMLAAWAVFETGQYVREKAKEISRYPSVLVARAFVAARHS